MEQIDGGLKRLGFARDLAINAAVGASSLYDSAKQNSGLLKSTIGTVENAVTTVASPVLEKYKGVPDDLVGFLDKKVDDASKKFDEHAPLVVKNIVNVAGDVVKKSSQAAQNLVQEAQLSGSRAMIALAASLLKAFLVSQLALLKTFLVSQLAVVWYRLNRCWLLHTVGEIVIPTVAYWSKIYNKFIANLDARGYHIFSYFPSVPVEDVAKAYKQVEAAAAKKDDGASSGKTD